MTAGPPITLQEAKRRSREYETSRATPNSYGHLVMRRFSPLVSWFIVRYTGLSADAVTGLSIASGTVAGLLVATADPGAFVVAIVLLQLAYLFDTADGEVARMRGSAGRRGVYLDLIGHVIQNRALFIGAALLLVRVTAGAPWALVVAFAALAFAAPFGVFARQQVLRAGGYDEHGQPAPTMVTGATFLGRLYRRVAFLWNYPASMNLFCLALLIDAVAIGAGLSASPWATPTLFAVFGGSLAAKQIAHAVRLLGTHDWDGA
jgi:phosphatidylglycerophosphate synthase